jgi:hypothetical protein
VPVLGFDSRTSTLCAKRYESQLLKSIAEIWRYRDFSTVMQARRTGAESMSQISGTTGIYCQYALKFCRLDIQVWPVPLPAKPSRTKA